MLVNEESFEDKLKLLIRALRMERFRFIVIQYNHDEVRHQVKTLLKDAFSSRDTAVFDLNKITSNAFFGKIFQKPKGMIFLENFEYLLDDETLAYGFNQRRDRLSRHPIQLVAFLPAGENYILACEKKIPDMWSLVNLVLFLEVNVQPIKPNETIRDLGVASFAGAKKQYVKKVELQNLEKRIIENIEVNFVLTLNLFEQAVSLAIELGDYEKALHLSNNWLKLAQDKFEKNSLEIARIFSIKANILRYIGSYLEAKELLDSALATARSKNEKNDVAAFQNNLALVLRSLGNYEGAKSNLEEALDYVIDNYGENHPNVTVAYSNLAMVLRDLGNYKRARRLLEKVASYDEENYGKHHKITALRYSNLAQIFQDIGNFLEAKNLLERALIITIDNFGDGHPNTASILTKLASISIDLKEYKPALKFAYKALKIFKETLPDRHPTIIKLENYIKSIQRERKENSPPTKKI